MPLKTRQGNFSFFALCNIILPGVGLSRKVSKSSQRNGYFLVIFFQELFINFPFCISLPSVQWVTDLAEDIIVIFLQLMVRDVAFYRCLENFV